MRKVTSIGGAMAFVKNRGSRVALVWIGIVVCAGAVVFGQQQPPPATLPSEMTWEQVVEQMNLKYAPREGEVIRVVPPPLLEVRNEWLRRNRHPEGVEMVMMVWQDGALTGRVYGSGGHYLPSVRDFVLGFRWYEIEGLNQISWPHIPGDLVVRHDATRTEKLAAFAKYITEHAGTRYGFVTQKRTRACIVVSDPLAPGRFRRPDGNATFVSQQPPDEFVIARSQERNLPPGYENAGSQFDELGERLDAPIFRVDPGGRDPINVFLVAPDAQLDASDPQHVPKLRKIIGNLQEQIGGEWKIEEREFEVHVIDPRPGPHPAQRVFEEYVRAIGNGDETAATALCEPQSQVIPNDLQAILPLNSKSVTIYSIKSDGKAAMVRSNYVMNEQGRLGLVLMHLRPDQEGRWKVYDLAVLFQFTGTLTQEFLAAHPRAGDIYPRRGTQELERQR